ncbi:hypothetical protein Tco_1231922, partial [Tanacetum coccineum]
MCCIRVFVNKDSFQLALEFGIVTELVLLKAPYERRPSTGKCTQGPFSWGPAIGGEGACTRLTLPNVENLRPFFGYTIEDETGLSIKGDVDRTCFFCSSSSRLKRF